MKRTAIYCRVSTDMEMQEGSFELQKDYYLKKIEDDPDLTLVDVYGDYGKSGTSIRKRSELKRLLKDCEEGKIDLILTKSLSRFSRNVADCIEMIRKLKKLGVSIRFEKEGIDTSNPVSEMLITILASIAEEESISFSQNIRWAQEQAYAEGNPWFRCSYGYKKSDGTWVIDDKQAERVRMAYRLAAEGNTYPTIQQALNACEEKHGSDYRWSIKRIRYMLHNVVYVGDLITNKNYSNGPGMRLRVNRGEHSQYYIENHHEPIVSKAEYERVQNRTASNRRKQLQKNDNAFIADSSWKEKVVNANY